MVISGENFDDCYRESVAYAQTHDLSFIHPFDDKDVVAGQGTLGVELVSALKKAPDTVLVPVGGGGLAAGVCVALKSIAPNVRIVGVEAEGAEAMRQSLNQGQRSTFRNIDTFADGTAVDTPGVLGFSICQSLLDDVVVVSRVDIVEAIYQLNNDYGMVVEPSGALSFAALKHLELDCAERVVSVISGGNNDAARFQEYQQILSSAGLKKPA
ncbi:threonine dehydratase [Reinekea blandensis MED297]|uniref:Threonine dehydratase n=1 Tax=Reinekea blandensis MED297 TaxID=314283 RepID=A4BDM2_9GAMM|nr:threonine dehydratase [Reinekea blandensis MED297]